MQTIGLFLAYFRWHYSRAYRDTLAIWFNFAWFITHFFSIPLLIRTLLSPWKRMTERPQEHNAQAVFESIIVNVLSRMVGFVIRAALIISGVVSLILHSFGLLLFMVVWTLLPILSVAAIVTGLFTLNL